MSKITVGICAFLAGFSLAFALNTSKPSMTVSATESQAALSDSNRSVFHGGGVANGGRGVVIGGAVPQFVSLNATPIFEDFRIADTRQALDGLDCRNCTFENVALEYGGGPYNLVNTRFLGTTSLEFTGAAANALTFLNLLKSVSTGTAVVPPPPNKPVRRKAVAKSPSLPKIDFRAPFIGPK